jgi:hypothetical protein
MRSYCRALTVVILLQTALLLLLATPATAETDAALLTESEALGIAVMRSSMVTWEQSMLKDYCPRLSTIAGPIERIAEAASYLTPDMLESYLGNTHGEITGETLGYMLTASCRPALLENNPYINITKERWPNGKSFEAAVYEEIMKQPSQVMPSDALYIAIYMCENDYWLATLTLHNLLKEAAYASRDKEDCVLAFDPAAPHDTYQHYSVKPNDLIAKLVNLRPVGDQHYKDVIGPWYHMFGILFYSGVTSCGESLLLAKTENFTRWLRMGSSPDAFKETVNVWAAHTSEMLNDLVGEIPNLTHKYVERLPADRLEAQLEWINNKHGEIQLRLEADRAVILKGDSKAQLAEDHMDYLRAYQRALVSEANRLKAGQNSK